MNTFRKWIRIIHRDLGFVMVGLCIVYGISGFVLNHMGNHNPAYKTTEGIVSFSPNLTSLQVKTLWAEKQDLPQITQISKINDDHYRLLFKGGIGIYNLNTGKVEYEQHKKRIVIYYFSKLHYNSAHGWTIIADIFAFSLVFFAISGIFMVRGKKGIAGRGKWFLLLGLLIPLFYMILSK